MQPPPAGSFCPLSLPLAGSGPLRCAQGHLGRPLQWPSSFSAHCPPPSRIPRPCRVPRPCQPQPKAWHTVGTRHTYGSPPQHAHLFGPIHDFHELLVGVLKALVQEGACLPHQVPDHVVVQQAGARGDKTSWKRHSTSPAGLWGVLSPSVLIPGALPTPVSVCLVLFSKHTGSSFFQGAAWIFCGKSPQCPVQCLRTQGLSECLLPASNWNQQGKGWVGMPFLSGILGSREK